MHPSPSLLIASTTWRVGRGLAPVEEGRVAPRSFRGVRSNRTDTSAQLLPNKEVGCRARGASPKTRGCYLGSNRQREMVGHTLICTQMPPNLSATQQNCQLPQSPSPTLSKRGTQYLPVIADANAVQQPQKLLSLGSGDDLASRGSVLIVLLPAPHHQLPQENRAWQVLSTCAGACVTVVHMTSTRRSHDLPSE